MSTAKGSDILSPDWSATLHCSGSFCHLSVSIYRWKWIMLFGVGHNINDERRLILIQFKIHCVWMQGVMLLHPWFLIHCTYKLLLLPESIPLTLKTFLLHLGYVCSFVCRHICPLLCYAQLIATFLFGSSSTRSYSHAVKNVKSVVTRWELLQ